MAVTLASRLAAFLAPPTTTNGKAALGSGLATFNYESPLRSMDGTPQAKMRNAQALYHSNPWVRIAEDTVTRRVSNIGWHLEDDTDTEIDDTSPDRYRLPRDLIEKPQMRLGDPLDRQLGYETRRALWAITSRHMGLCGIAYWYLDQMERIGRTPMALLYVNPARVWPATTTNGRITGWILKDREEDEGVPLALDELLPFYLSPPDWGHIGSGLAEVAWTKVQISGLAERHAGDTLSAGGRLAGIVAPKTGTIPDEQYQALVRNFRNVTESPDSTKRVTIVQGPIDFTSTASNPEQLDLINLAKMERDDILAIWGVPPTMAAVVEHGGGLNSGETRKYDEATLMQGSVHDRLTSLRETIQYRLLDRYQKVGVTVELEIEEPEYDDRAPMFALAREAVNLPLTNAQRLALIGEPPTGDPAIDNAIMLPSLQTLWATAPSKDGPNLDVGATMDVTAKAAPPKKLAPRKQFLGLRRSVETRIMPAVRSSVAEALAMQRKNVARKLRTATPDEISRQRKNVHHWFPQSEDKRLREALRPHVAGIGTTVSTRVRTLMPHAKADPFTDSVIATLERSTGTRISGINDTTRLAVADAIETGFDEGLSPAEIADLIDGLPAFDEARAEMIARTETMFAYNAAALGSYSEYGVTEVEAIDGDEDTECAERDGQIYSLDEADAIEDHPNGTLDWVPVIAEGKAVTDNNSNDMMTALFRSLAQPPVINIPPTVVNLPAPVVNVTVPETIVNVTAPPAPVVNVPAPIVDTSEFTAAVNDMRDAVTRPVKKTVQRDAAGLITSITEQGAPR